jgi:hypothetical protein
MHPWTSGATCYNQAMRKCHCDAWECKRVQPMYEGNSNVAAARCDRVVVVQLEGPLEAVDSLLGTSSRTVHQAEARTPVQLP